MSQSRINAFFSPSVVSHEQQLWQDRAEHSAAVQEAETQRGDRRAQARLEQIRVPPVKPGGI